MKNYSGGQCYDFIKMEPEDVDGHLLANLQNVVILSPNGLSNAICTSKEALYNATFDPSKISFACAGANGQFPIDYTMPFVRIDLREFPVYVPLVDVEHSIHLGRG